MEVDWYRRQIKGLYMIVDDGDEFISKDYVKEKLKMIILGHGINFHPVIKKFLDEEKKND